MSSALSPRSLGPSGFYVISDVNGLQHVRNSIGIDAWHHVSADARLLMYLQGFLPEELAEYSEIGSYIKKM